MALGSTLATEDRRAPRSVNPRLVGGRTQMTARVLEVKALLCAGLSAKQTAERLNISVGSAKLYYHFVYKFTNKTRTELIMEASRLAAFLSDCKRPEALREWVNRYALKIPSDAMSDLLKILDFTLVEQGDRWLD